MKIIYFYILLFMNFSQVQGSFRAAKEPELGRFNLLLGPDCWHFSERAWKAYQKEYPEDKNPVSTAFIKTWRENDFSKNSLDNWALYAFGKGKSAESFLTVSVEEFAKLLPTDGHQITRLVKRSEGSHIVIIRYARTAYKLGVIARTQGRVAVAASQARQAAEYAQQEAAAASGKERLCMLDRQIDRETGCKKCLAINKTK